MQKFIRYCVAFVVLILCVGSTTADKRPKNQPPPIIQYSDNKCFRNNLVVLYDFEDTTAPPIIEQDISGQENPLHRYNATIDTLYAKRIVPNSAGGILRGYKDYAPNGYMYIPQKQLTRIMNAQNTGFSIEMWVSDVNRNPSNSPAAVFAIYDPVYNGISLLTGKGWRWDLLASGVANNQRQTFFTNAIYNPGKYFTHIVATFKQGDGLRLYLNGEYVARLDTSMYSNVLLWQNSISVSHFANMHHTGLIQNIAVWNTTLSKTNVTCLYNLNDPRYGLLSNGRNCSACQFSTPTGQISLPPPYIPENTTSPQPVCNASCPFTNATAICSDDLASAFRITNRNGAVNITIGYADLYCTPSGCDAYGVVKNVSILAGSSVYIYAQSRAMIRVYMMPSFTYLYDLLYDATPCSDVAGGDWWDAYVDVIDNIACNISVYVNASLTDNEHVGVDSQFLVQVSADYIDSLAYVKPSTNCMSSVLASQIDANWSSNITHYTNEFGRTVSTITFSQVIPFMTLYNCFNSSDFIYYSSTGYVNLNGKINITLYRLENNQPLQWQQCKYQIQSTAHGVSSIIYGTGSSSFTVTNIDNRWVLPQGELQVTIETCIAKPNGMETILIDPTAQAISTNDVSMVFTSVSSACHNLNPDYNSRCCQYWVLQTIGAVNKTACFTSNQPLSWTVDYPDDPSIISTSVHTEMHISVCKPPEVAQVQVQGPLSVAIQLYRDTSLLVPSSHFVHGERMYAEIILSPLAPQYCNTFQLIIQQAQVCVPTSSNSPTITSCSDPNAIAFKLYDSFGYTGGVVWQSALSADPKYPDCASKLVLSYIARVLPPLGPGTSIMLEVEWYYVPYFVGNSQTSSSSSHLLRTVYAGAISKHLSNKKSTLLKMSNGDVDVMEKLVGSHIVSGVVKKQMFSHSYVTQQQSHHISVIKEKELYIKQEQTRVNSGGLYNYLAPKITTTGTVVVQSKHQTNAIYQQQQQKQTIASMQSTPPQQNNAAVSKKDFQVLCPPGTIYVNDVGCVVQTPNYLPYWPAGSWIRYALGLIAIAILLRIVWYCGPCGPNVTKAIAIPAVVQNNNNNNNSMQQYDNRMNISTQQHFVEQHTYRGQIPHAPAIYAPPAQQHWRFYPPLQQQVPTYDAKLNTFTPVKQAFPSAINPFVGVAIYPPQIQIKKSK